MDRVSLHYSGVAEASHLQYLTVRSDATVVQSPQEHFSGSWRLSNYCMGAMERKSV